MSKRQLNTREAIQQFVESFYVKVKADALLGPIFNNAENFSWDTHIPIMIDFWETLLLHTASYKGNTMGKHIELHRRSPISADHFERWKALFFDTLDNLFEGPEVVEAHERVEAMSALMQYKMQQSERKGFIQ